MAHLAATRLNEKATKAVSPRLTWWGLVIFCAVFGLACLIIFNNLGRFPLFNPDEGLYAEPAREMHETGEYITTWLNYAVRYTKPPLCIWAMSFCYQIFGVTEFAARFFGAACGAILLACTFLLARIHINTRAAIFTALVLMTAPLYIGVAREAITDMPLSLFMTGGLMCFYHGYFGRADRGTGTRNWKWLGWVLLGCAVMTKGPVGAVLPAAVLAIFHTLRRDLKQAVLYYQPWYGALIVAAIAGPWFATEISVTKGAYFREFILRENFQRFTGVVDHKAPWWYHIAAMLGGFFPWSIFLPAAVAAALPGSAGVPPASKSATLIPSVASSIFLKIDRIHPLVLFSLCLSVFTLTFFSASVSKLFPYTLPAFPALALLVGYYFDSSITAKRFKSMAWAFAVLSIVYGMGWIALPIVSNKLQDCPPALIGLIVSVLVVQFAGTIVSLLLLAKRLSVQAISAFCTITFLSSLVLGGAALSILSDRWEQPIRKYAQFAGASNWPIVVYQIRKPSVTFYAGRKILLPRSEKDLDWILRKSKNAYIIARSRDEEYLRSIAGNKVLNKSGQYLLLGWKRPLNMVAPTSSAVPSSGVGPSSGVVPFSTTGPSTMPSSTEADNND